MRDHAKFSALLNRMRSDWNERARKDAYFYAAFRQPRQSEEDFLASSRDVLPALEEDFHRLTTLPDGPRRALEIGCGPGRLMLAMANHFDEIHGVDVSDEMIAMAGKTLRGVNAHVHLTSGADLALFPVDHFDFVYSYVVFQHIPSREIVLNYLAEAQRVLKPGGVLRCQIRGSTPDPSELKPGAETWTGCSFTADEILQFAKAQCFPLVALSGIRTQCMWTTFRKGRGGNAEASARTVVRGVTAASGAERQIPARGARAAVSLWVSGVPDDISLADCLVCFDACEQVGCYVSPVSETGACQINAVLPGEAPPGLYKVTLKIKNQPASGTHEITVVEPPAEPPQIVALTDGVNLASDYRLETRSARVIIRNIQAPEKLSFRVSGSPVVCVWHECVEAVTGTWSFHFRIDPLNPPGGRAVLSVNVGGREVASANFEITKAL